MDMECILCLKNNDNGSVVHMKGLKNLLKASIIRSDERVTVKVSEALESGKFMKVCSTCRKCYTDARSLAKCQAGPQIIKKLRSATPVAFTWKKHCFLCSRSINSGNNARLNWKAIRCVRKLEFRAQLSEVCVMRCDEWSIEVNSRLQQCHDLVSVGARYHKLCHQRFVKGQRRLSGTVEKVDRSIQIGHNVRHETFLQMCNWLENGCDADLYSLCDLQDKMRELSTHPDSIYSTKHLKRKLLDKYGDGQLVFANVAGRKNVLCWHDMASHILSDKWYEERKENVNEERERIVLLAAKLVKEELRELSCSRDMYPSENEIRDMSLGEQLIPPLLKCFMGSVVHHPLKRLALSQCIVQAAKPRTALMPIPLGVGIDVDHLTGSKLLVTELSRLGLSVTSDEVTRFKQSVLVATKVSNTFPQFFPGSFTQWVADNVDHDIATLDGKGTFHGMGVIAASTTDPSSNYGCHSVKRLHRMKVGDLTTDCGIPIKVFRECSKFGLASTQFSHRVELEKPFVLPLSINLDLVWHMGRHFTNEKNPTPSWSGFMQHVCKGPDDGTTTASTSTVITFLPLLDMNPNDDTCIYSTLSFIQQQAQQLNVHTPCVTFDQPLWLKAVSIVKMSPDLNVVCRLGGFHLLMSFLGSLGCVMSGSGLEEMLQTIYGENAVTHMMSGKAVARAMRGHYLVEAALMTRIMSRIIDIDSNDDGNSPPHLSITEVEELKGIYFKVMSEGFRNQELPPVFIKLENAIVVLIDMLSTQSRTARLWLQYMKYVSVIRLFVLAERTGHWYLHLTAVNRMLNLFAATGHNNYAKSARLYLQMMYSLKDTHPKLHEEFVNGQHVVRRSDRYWAGLWTDLTIEQTLMKSIKGNGGLTRGRGMSETVSNVWVHSLHACGAVHQSMASLVGLDVGQSDEHKEFGKTRAVKDLSDLNKISLWLDDNDPFVDNDGKLHSLGTGAMSTGKDGINCDSAEDVGQAIQLKLDGMKFNEVKLRRADQIKTLQSLQKGLIIDSKLVHIDPMTLFNRLLIVVERTGEMMPMFAYELTTMPTSLFKNGLIRKADKASLARFISKNASVTAELSASTCVVDGGALLHRVRWSGCGTYASVIERYTEYVVCKYGMDAVVVFDGYQSGPGIKDQEHQRRAVKAMANIKLDENKPAATNQQAFLSNEKNKCQLIDLLKQNLQSNGRTVVQAGGDADTLIVAEALKIASQHQPVTVVSDDTDVLIMLVHHCSTTMSDIFMLNEQGNHRTLSVKRIRADIGPKTADLLPLIHAISGCDSTSAMYGIGKITCLKKLTSSTAQVPSINALSSACCSQQVVGRCGIDVIKHLYGCETNTSLNCQRYFSYLKRIAHCTSRPRPEQLPPTERAAYFHCLRAYYQTDVWKKLTGTDLQPTDWGWKLDNSLLIPIPTDQEPAPSEILNIIRCNCKSSSRNQCGTQTCTCRKNGLRCIRACGGCKGVECMNASQASNITPEVLDIPTEEQYDSDSLEWEFEETVGDGNDDDNEIAGVEVGLNEDSIELAISCSSDSDSSCCNSDTDMMES